MFSVTALRFAVRFAYAGNVLCVFCNTRLDGSIGNCPNCTADAGSRAHAVGWASGIGRAHLCVGCGKSEILLARELDEVDPSTGLRPLYVSMCPACWVKYDGPDGDRYAWGEVINP